MGQIKRDRERETKIKGQISTEKKTKGTENNR